MCDAQGPPVTNGYRKHHGVRKANDNKFVGTGVLDGPLQTVRIAENFVKWTVEAEDRQRGGRAVRQRNFAKR